MYRSLFGHMLFSLLGGIPFPASQASIQGICGFAPFVCILMLTSRSLPALSPGWGILEEKMGNFITGLVIEFCSSLPINLLSSYFSELNSCFLYSVQAVQVSSVRDGTSGLPLSYPEPVSPLCCF